MFYEKICYLNNKFRKKLNFYNFIKIIRLLKLENFKSNLKGFKIFVFSNSRLLLSIFVRNSILLD